MLKVGFTGASSGMSLRQMEVVAHLLNVWGEGITEKYLIHGDCVGADSSADYFGRYWGYRIVIRPPVNESKRAFCYRGGDILHGQRPYQMRNQALVEECERLIATPKKEYPRGGTWYTVEYARKLKRPIYLVMADGTLITENGEVNDQ